jgi:hypothetical protein
MFYRALKKDIKFILLIKSLCCLYLSIFLNVNKKNQFMALLEKNLAQLLKKNYIVLRNFIHLSSNSPITMHSKPNGRYPAYPKSGISKI